MFRRVTLAAGALALVFFAAAVVVRLVGPREVAGMLFFVGLAFLGTMFLVRGSGLVESWRRERR